MKLGWILASVVLLALLAAPDIAAADDLADEFSIENESDPDELNNVLTVGPAFGIFNESDPDEWNNKGYALYLQGNYDEAIQDYKEAIRLDPEFVWPWYNKGLAFEKQGKYDEAIKA